VLCYVFITQGTVQYKYHTFQNTNKAVITYSFVFVAYLLVKLAKYPTVCSIKLSLKLFDP